MSFVKFPVQAKIRSQAKGSHSKTKIRSQANGSLSKDELEVVIFDTYGYWVSLGPGGCLLPGDMLDLGNKIATMLNAAYEQGRRDAKRDIREALGVHSDD